MIGPHVHMGPIKISKTFVSSILMKIEPGGDMGGRTPTPSSSSSFPPVNSWTRACQRPREIPCHSKKTNFLETKSSETTINLNFLKLEKKKTFGLSQRPRKCGRKPSIISPTPFLAFYNK